MVLDLAAPGGGLEPVLLAAFTRARVVSSGLQRVPAPGRFDQLPATNDSIAKALAGGASCGGSGVGTPARHRCPLFTRTSGCVGPVAPQHLRVRISFCS